MSDTTGDAMKYPSRQPKKAYLQQWLSNAAASKEQITTTVYDLASKDVPGGKDVTPYMSQPQNNTRNRVSFTSFTKGNNPANFDTATFYSYGVLLRGVRQDQWQIVIGEAWEFLGKEKKDVTETQKLRHISMMTMVIILTLAVGEKAGEAGFKEGQSVTAEVTRVNKK